VAGVHAATAADVYEGLKQFTREFSQFHVTMAKLRIGKQELGLAARVMNGLDSQISRLELDMKSHSRLLKLRGAGSSTPATS